jgi:cardiolipin synthase (CMP-forming)
MKIKLNIPNVLSFFRILLVPVAVVFVLKDQMTSGFVVYFVACLTDVVDGVIARKFNMITDAGKLLDPLADKIMSVSMVITFTIIGVLPLFICIFVTAKELLMIAGGLFLYKSNVVTSSNGFGKASAVLFNTSIGFTFLYKTIENAYLYLMYLAIAFALAALLQYIYLNFHRKHRLFSFKSEQDEKMDTETDAEHNLQ